MPRSHGPRFPERTLATMTLGKHRTSVGTIEDEKLGACVTLTMHGPKARVAVQTNDALGVKDFARSIEAAIPHSPTRQRPALKSFVGALYDGANRVLRWNHGP